MKTKTTVVVVKEIVYEVHVRNLVHPDDDFNPDMIVKANRLMGSYATRTEADARCEEVRIELVEAGYCTKESNDSYKNWLRDVDQAKFDESHPFCKPVFGGWEIRIEERIVAETSTEEVVNE